MQVYHCSISGYTGLTTFNEIELKAFLKVEITRARNYFGTAVCHKNVSEDNKTIWYDVTARKDKRSARWLCITAYKQYTTKGKDE